MEEGETRRRATLARAIRAWSNKLDALYFALGEDRRIFDLRSADNPSIAVALAGGLIKRSLRWTSVTPVMLLTAAG